nr:uncharacterized protein LOC112547551 [Pelodiscus sinensis]|eukprot:XP_025045791.1 uncharacterized protein LOC112547551 [Pelodiscus sinensis]
MLRGTVRAVRDTTRSVRPLPSQSEGGPGGKFYPWTVPLKPHGELGCGSPSSWACTPIHSLAPASQSPFKAEQGPPSGCFPLQSGPSLPKARAGRGASSTAGSHASLCQFILKHDKYQHLREVERFPNSLNPHAPDTLPLLKSLLSQVIDKHRHASWIHIGADERQVRDVRLRSWEELVASSRPSPEDLTRFAPAVESPIRV